MKSIKRVVGIVFLFLAFGLAGCAVKPIPPEQLSLPVHDVLDEQDPALKKAMQQYLTNVRKKSNWLLTGGGWGYPRWALSSRDSGMAEVEVTMYGGQPRYKVLSNEGDPEFIKDTVPLVNSAARSAWMDESLRDKNFRFTVMVTYAWEFMDSRVYVDVR